MTTGQKVNVRARRWRELVRQDLLELMGDKCRLPGGEVRPRESAVAAAKSFEALPHRLEFVGEKSGI